MGEVRRTRSVGTKLTEEEYAKLEALAAQRGVTPGEWVREIVLAAFDKPQPEATPSAPTKLTSTTQPNRLTLVGRGKGPTLRAATGARGWAQPARNHPIPI